MLRVWVQSCHIDNIPLPNKQLGRRISSQQIFGLKSIVGSTHQSPAISQRRSYQYAPLRTGEIRLLELKAGRCGNAVHCTLRNVALNDKPTYESLSYCWGKERGDDAVYCGNKSIPVTRNLLGALQHLRREDRSRTLWADALSIDQRNVKERGQQVGMMRDIFRYGERTVVWLGPAGQDSPRAVQLIRQLADASQGQETSALPAKLAASHPPLYDPAWGALASLLKRPWWHRAWIVQEATVSSRVVFRCGGETFSWDDIERAVRHAVNLGFFVASGGSATFQALSLFQTRKSFQNAQRPPLHDVLLQHRSSLATDARDKVFGLLSLADEEDVAAMNIQADYNRSSVELFTSISRSLLASGNLGAFKAAGVRIKPSGLILPSWVSDWSVSDSTVALDTPVSLDYDEKPSHNTGMTPHFDASSSTTCQPVFTKNDTLKLQGIPIDQIEAVGVLSRTRYLRHVSHMFELFVQCHDILEQLDNWEEIARIRTNKLYPTGERLRDAYWSTLYAGRVPPYLRSEHHDSRYKYYILVRMLRAIVRGTIPWFPRSTGKTWYNRFFFASLQIAWRVLGLTPSKIQGIGFPPESRLPNGRRMVRTKKGYIGLAPRGTREGDWVVVCEGGRVPLVVRREGKGWVLVGEGYVHGIMGGEAWVGERCEDLWFK